MSNIYLVTYEEIKYRKSLHCQLKGIKASLISTLIYVRTVH